MSWLADSLLGCCLDQILDVVQSQLEPRSFGQCWVTLLYGAPTGPRAHVRARIVGPGLSYNDTFSRYSEKA
jgi:hypothetical protein